MASSKSLPPTGFGLLGMTWRPSKTPDEQAFAAMKAAIAGGAILWSSASTYGMPPEPPTAGLWLLRRYFEKYPEDAPKVTLFVRACFDAATLTPRNTREGVRSSFIECNEILAGVKKMDIFGPARMDRNVPLEETVRALKELVDEGHIGAVGLSEVGATTIRRAAAVCHITAVEIEFSLWSTEMLTNGVAEACKEHGVMILAYAPLGYGFLTGHVTKLEDIPQGDIRHLFGRFQPENFHKNLELVEKVNAFAKQRGVTSAQLALAWIRAHSNTDNCGTIIPIPGATAQSRVEENCQVVEISVEEKNRLDEIIKSIEVVGERQIVGMSDEHLWT
ncbi:NADP-dependent oxidoreductase domain-containing protein [Aspergillus tamarii]|uniref:NADP-dependent oxidoreductase domain-containing protein n=1 Tax=Aspergillus tamarii TaxID=41984 RepID=A0A5N6V956_ASPTM|nr:NADP-dependent oxidoreductase domain-containing protein [Aspergillus tamarii]